ncbi:MAG: hypothetical protein ABS81_10875 [Pseudonocardia sp. SCN 72-86]|nr:MAG: hypothetical protein ABS81_10875 [Pseudonocardia sp. SCN 72-86]
MIRGLADLAPYLSTPWRQRFERTGVRMFARARDRYNHPNTAYRLDAVPSRSGPAGSDPRFTIDDHVEPYGITAALLLPQDPYGITVWSDAAAAHEFTRANNDFLIDRWVEFDDRYVLAVTVSPHDARQAAAEIQRCASIPGVVAVQLLLRDTMLGSTWFDPVYEAATEHGLPIVFHQNGNEGCYHAAQAPAGGIPRSYGERHVVLTQIGAANLADLVISGAFERFPTLRMVMVEWGFSWLPSLAARLDHMWLRDPDAAPLIRRLPSEYLAEHVTFTTQPLDEPDTPADLAALLAVPQVIDTLLFSSDYPHYDTDDPQFVLKRIPAESRAKVCYENALRVFGAPILRSLPAAQR